MSRQGFIEKERMEVNLAVFKKGEARFEIVVDPDAAVAFREGRISEIRDVLKSEHIFSDVQKGLKASDQLMNEVFGTGDELEAAAKILREGEIQLSAEFRRKLRDARKNKVIELIHVGSINPQTNTPHPRDRIEAAMEEAKIRIDEFKKPEEQVEHVIKALMRILPIKYEVRQVEVLIDAKYAPQSYAILKSFGNLEDTQWQNNGSLLARIKLPAGLQSDLIDRLNSLTHGSALIKILEK